MKEDKNKFAIFTAFGEGLSLAWHLQQEGYEVLVGMVSDIQDVGEDEEAPKNKKIRWSAYDGMLKKQDAWKLLEKMDKFKPEEKDEWCVIFDFNVLYKFADKALKTGFKYGLFPTKLDFVLESDRDFAKRFVLKNYPDLKVAEVQEFKKVEEGIEFLRESDEFWALKGNHPDAKTVVPSAAILEHAIGELEDALNSSRSEYESGGFIFERQIREGLEVCPKMIWVDGKRVASIINLEDKRVSPNNGSAMEGCAIDILVSTPLDCMLNSIAFPPITDSLAKKHKGIFSLDANLIIKDGIVYFLEFCSGRLGYDEIFIECEMAGGVGHFFNSILKEESPYFNKYGVASRGFATKRDDEGLLKEDLRIQYEDDAHLWHFAAKKDGDKILNTKGSFGNPVRGVDLVAFTESSDDAEYACIKLQQVIDSYSFPGLLVRNDCSTLLGRLDGLEKYISEPENEYK